MTLHERACRLSTAIAHVFGHPYAVLAFPAVCGAVWASPVPVEVQTYVLSVLAITTGQAVLVLHFLQRGDDERRDRALHLKIDGLVRGVAGVPDELAGIEREGGR